VCHLRRGPALIGRKRNDNNDKKKTEVDGTNHSAVEERKARKKNRSSKADQPGCKATSIGSKIHFQEECPGRFLLSHSASDERVRPLLTCFTFPRRQSRLTPYRHNARTAPEHDKHLHVAASKTRSHSLYRMSKETVRAAFMGHSPQLFHVLFRIPCERPFPCMCSWSL
jgi:hypothetical protein